MNTTAKYSLGIIIVILLLVFCMKFLVDSDRNSIKSWATEHNTETALIEYRIFGGPFFHFKNTRVYKVEMKNGAVYWFRFGFAFRGLEVEQE